jgi:uncharacterized protein YoxC
MFCDQCADAHAKGQKFCSNCGSATDALTVEALNKQIAGLSTQVAQLLAVRKETEQTFLEVDTAEKVVNRLMSWAKLFGFFIGIPAGLILIGLGIWAGKSIKGFQDIANTAQSSVNEKLEKARGDAKAAEEQATKALDTAKVVNQNIQGTQERLNTLGASVKQSADKVGQLDTGVSQQRSRLANLTAATAAQSKAVDDLSTKVQTLDKSRLVQDIGRSHPEFGAHVVYGPSGEILSAATKPTGKLYVQIEVFNEDTFKPKFTPDGIAVGVSTLQDHGFVPLFGQVALFATTGQTSTPVGSLGVSSCRAAGMTSGPAQLGVPCVVYFRDDMKGRALGARDLLSGIEKIPDDHVKLVPLSKLIPAQKELVEKSGLDIVIVLGP